VRRYLRDVQDHALRVTEQVVGFREILQNILSVNLTLVGLSQNEEVNKLTRVSIEQNEEVKRISAWAAILFAPTLVGTIYGMNFNHMPELHWLLGYPFALLLMLVTSVSLYAVFKQRGWL
jgi:magnesium transporter